MCPSPRLLPHYLPADRIHSTVPPNHHSWHVHAGHHVVYEQGLTAIIVYLYVGQFLFKNRIAQALAALFGTPVSGGSVATMTAQAAGRLDEFGRC